MMRLLGSFLLTMLVVMTTHAAMDDNSIRERTMPVGKLCLEGEECGSASAAAAPSGPEDIYANACQGCHASGMLGAPKYGDAAAWNDRMSVGFDALVASAIAGKGAMPPKGGCTSCSDEDIAATIQYILDNSK